MAGPGFAGSNKNLTPPKIASGLGYTGAYQVSGIPFLTGSTISGATELQVSFPKVTKAVTVSNLGSDGIRVYFNSATDGNVIGGNHFYTIEASASFTFNVKCKEIYLAAASGGSSDFEMYAELTSIEPALMVALTGSGLTD